MTEEIKDRKKSIKILLIVLIVFISFVILFSFYSVYFAHKVYPGVYLNRKSLANYSYSDIYNFLETKKGIFYANGITYKYGDKEINVQPVVITIGDDIINQELVDFDNTYTAKQAFSIGRRGNAINNIFEQIKILVIPKKVVWKYYFDEASWKNILRENFASYEKKYKDPYISFDGDNIIINDAVTGNEFDYDKIIKQTKKNIDNFDFDKIELSLEDINSSVSKDEATKHIEDISKIIDAKEINFKYEEKSWKITDANYKNWIIFKKDGRKVYATFDYDKFKEYFDKYIAVDVNQDAKDSKFSIQAGRVNEFQNSQEGKKVNTEKVFELVEQNLQNIVSSGKNEDINLIVDVTKSEIDVSNINNFGIKEIIGTGVSDFKGSPPNRIANIKAGARILNGLLIAPGQEFSTMKNLLPVDASNGFLQELVIKGDKTIPEYGGGLCQIGTTMFRAALQSGLNITERRNHSYRVVYYEPAGTDATIYDPRPDLKFINDTENYILIQSRIVGTKIYFDFWGTKDGRKVTVSKSTIYNIKQPGPTKLIETNDLTPGTKKCTESAHAGADAYFDYTVEYGDGRQTKKERFSSHYVPWQAVCLIGASSTSTNTGANNTTSSTSSSSQTSSTTSINTSSSTQE